MICKSFHPSYSILFRVPATANCMSLRIKLHQVQMTCMHLKTTVIVTILLTDQIIIPKLWKYKFNISTLKNHYKASSIKNQTQNTENGKNNQDIFIRLFASRCATTTKLHKKDAWIIIAYTWIQQFHIKSMSNGCLCHLHHVTGFSFYQRNPGPVFCLLLGVSSGCAQPICDWLSIVWAYSEQETENRPRSDN